LCVVPLSQTATEKVKEKIVENEIAEVQKSQGGPFGIVLDVEEAREKALSLLSAVKEEKMPRLMVVALRDSVTECLRATVSFDEGMKLIDPKSVLWVPPAVPDAITCIVEGNQMHDQQTPYVHKQESMVVTSPDDLIERRHDVIDCVVCNSVHRPVSIIVSYAEKTDYPLCYNEKGEAWLDPPLQIYLHPFSTIKFLFPDDADFPVPLRIGFGYLTQTNRIAIRNVCIKNGQLTVPDCEE